MPNKLPKDERVWVSYRKQDGELRFVITSKSVRDQYFLYEATPDGFKKLGRSASPEELACRFDVINKLK